MNGQPRSIEQVLNELDNQYQTVTDLEKKKVCGMPVPIPDCVEEKHAGLLDVLGFFGDMHTFSRLDLLTELGQALGRPSPAELTPSIQSRIWHGARDTWRQSATPDEIPLLDGLVAMFRE